MEIAKIENKQEKNKLENNVDNIQIKCVLIKPKILNNETIMLLMDKKFLKKVRQKFPDIVIYFPPEIKKLYLHRKETDFIRKVHAFKKQFKGWICPS